MPYKDKETAKKRRRELWSNRTPEQKERRRKRVRLHDKRPERKEYQCKRRFAAKVEILTYYGNGNPVCVTCGESRLACLSLDHINNNGAEERRSRAKYGYNIYKHLKAQSFPSGYQTLCMNCQFIKAHERQGFYREVSGSQ